VGGSIVYKGKRIDGLAPHRITELGIVQIPQGRKIFPSMKIIEHLEMGAYLPGPRKQFKRNAEVIFDTYPILRERRNQMAGTLSGGEQQMLAIGRGLMSQPELLMLDEPTLGLSPKLALQLLGSLKQLSDRGITILLVSQETLQCLQLAERAYVLENGRVALQGLASEVLNNEAIKKSYLGL
jgi:branched-chain amino acid transport system ATP-binding protein